MNPYLTKLHEHLATHNIAGPTSIITFLSECYMEANPVHSEEICQIDTELEPFFDSLSLENSNRLFNLLCNLCDQYEREAFAAGLQTGLCLMLEIDRMLTEDGSQSHRDRKPSPCPR